MKKVITIILIMFSFFTKANSNYDQLVYEFSLIALMEKK